MDKKEFHISEQSSKKEYTGELPDLNNINPIEPSLFNDKELNKENYNQSNYNEEVFEKNEVKGKNKKIIISAIAGVSLLAAGTVTFAVNAFSNNESKNEANQSPKSEIVSTQTSNLDNNQKVESTEKQSSASSSNTENQEVTSLDANSGNNETNSSSNNSEKATTSEKENISSVETEKTAESLASSLEIPAGLSSEEYSDSIINVLEKWRNAGYVTQEDDSKLMDDWMNFSNTKLSAFAEPVAEQNADIFCNALFSPDYKQISNLVSLREQFIDENKSCIMSHLYTELDKKNKDGSFLSFNKISFTELYKNDNERSIEIVFNERINMEDLTSTDNELKQIEGNLTCIITSSNFGNTEKITDFTWATSMK